MHEHLKGVADEILDLFERVTAAASKKLEVQRQAAHRPGDPGVFAAVNTMTDERAVHKLADIQDGQAKELLQLMEQPAIARLVLRDDDGNEKTCFITRGGTLSKTEAGASIASYLSPIGRLAALRVGNELPTPLPPGITRNFELRERAALHPSKTLAGWDSSNTVFDAVGRTPVTIASLRQLLGRDAVAGADFLQQLIEADEAEVNVREGIIRSVLKKMVLRDQPLLDAIQDNIFRMPLSTQLAVLGPPGTGKTTTLIKRLGQKLNDQYLDENERNVVARTLAGPSKHDQSWMMFTPTELLKQYVKEAFALESIPASDMRTKTWSDYSRELARQRFGILRTDAIKGAFIYRAEGNPFQDGIYSSQIQWFNDFDNWQTQDFQAELLRQAAKFTGSADKKIAQLGKRLESIIGGEGSLVDKLLGIAGRSKDIQDLIKGSETDADTQVRNALGQFLAQNPEKRAGLTQFVLALADGGPDVDDADPDEEEVAEKPKDVRGAIEESIRAVRAQARAAASGRSLPKSSPHGRIIEYLGGDVLPSDKLKSIGISLQLHTASRRLGNPMRPYLTEMPQRYKRFRRDRQTADRWYKREGFVSTDIAPFELDAVLLAILRGGRSILRDPRVLRDVQQYAETTLETIRNLFRTQVVVDEATDFSPIQLACMASICDPAAESFFICGDFNQRITAWGARSLDELRWAAPNITVEPVNISYRHSQQLNELAFRLAQISDANAKKTALPEGVINEGMEPVLGKNLSDHAKAAQWLSNRIGEIERATKSLPSIAVLVNSEDEVIPLAKALDAALAERSIKAVACAQGQSVGQDNDVRVFDVQHIKGLEFEAVFFVGVDELADSLPDLFDKYLYVGTTRAATFLGLTTKGTSLPQAVVGLEGMFRQRWD